MRVNDFFILSYISDQTTQTTLITDMNNSNSDVDYDKIKREIMKFVLKQNNDKMLNVSFTSLRAFSRGIS